MRCLMLDEQLIGRGISDEKVLAAFRKVLREKFVPQEYRKNSYDDYPIPIGEGQTISQPYMVALMTQSLGLKGQEKVLEVGTGSGYQTAILAEIAGEVYSIERIGQLAKEAEKILITSGYRNFKIKIEDGTLGWEEHAPYDGIVVTAGAPSIPQSLVKQLKDGGRLVIPVGGGFIQTLTIVEKNGGSVTSRGLCGCVFVPLIGKEGWDD
jgi:protein-L-isoaspartate(D-aspartate) O-methyltransferase